MAFATTNTLMHVDTWADLMEIDPLVFNGAYADGCSEFLIAKECDGLWPQHRWQSYTNASREDLARAIKSAENAIELAISSPNRAKEIVDKFELSEGEKEVLLSGNTLRIKTTKKNIIVGGRFLYNKIGNYAVNIDVSQPTFDEFMATIVVSIAPEDVGTLEEYKLYYPGFIGESGHEITYDSIDYDEVLNELTFYVRTWNLLNIDKVNALPRTPANSYDPIIGIDMCDIESYQTTVDVAVKYVSSPLEDGIANATLVRSDGSHCTAKLTVLDYANGYVEIKLADLVEVNPYVPPRYEDADPVYPEQSIAFSLYAENTGEVPARNVVIYDPLPVGTTLVRVLDDGYFDGAECRWEVGDLQPGESVTVRMIVSVDRDATGDIINSAYNVISDDSTAIGEDVVITLAPGAEVLSIDKTYTYDVNNVNEINKYKWGDVCAYSSCGDDIVGLEITYIAGCTTNGTVYGAGCYDNEVAMIAVARIARDVCTCGCGKQTRVEDLRADWSVYDGTIARRILSSDITNPFGTRGGEILAWRRINQIVEDVAFAGLV